MDKRSFEELDQQFMEAMKPLREEKVPPHLLKGFKDAVWGKLRRAQQAPAPAPRAKRVWVPVWAPVLAVLILAVAVAIPTTGVRPVAYLAQADTAGISEEIAVLRELGAWTEEDEIAAGTTEDLSIEELEVLGSARNGDTALA